jgi:hypothetical protein
VPAARQAACPRWVTTMAPPFPLPRRHPQLRQTPHRSPAVLSFGAAGKDFPPPENPKVATSLGSCVLVAGDLSSGDSGSNPDDCSFWR